MNSKILILMCLVSTQLLAGTSKYGTYLKVLPNSELHMIACETALLDSVAKRTLPQSVSDQLEANIPELPVFIIEESFRGSPDEGEPGSSEIPAQGAHLSRLVAEFLTETALFNPNQTTVNDLLDATMLPLLLKSKSLEDLEKYIEEGAKELVGASSHYAGVEKILAHVVVGEYRVPVLFQKTSFEGRKQRRGRAISLPNSTQWSATALTPVRRDSPLYLSRVARSKAGKASFQTVVSLDESEIKKLPASVRSINEQIVYNETIGEPHDMDQYLIFENSGGDHLREVSKPSLFKVLNPENPIDVLGYLVNFNITETHKLEDRDEVYRTHGRGRSSKSTKTQKKTYKILYNSEGQRISSSIEANSVGEKIFTKAEEFLHLAGERLEVPFYAPVGMNIFNAGDDDYPWPELVEFFEKTVSSKTSFYETRKNVKDVMGSLEKKTKDWGSSEKEGFKILKKWILQNKKKIKAVGRTLEHVGEKEKNKNLKSHFLFITDREYIYFRL